MKREGMPTQRLEEKRVGEHAVGGRGERERKSTHTQERESTTALFKSALEKFL